MESDPAEHACEICRREEAVVGFLPGYVCICIQHVTTQIDAFHPFRTHVLSESSSAN